MEEWRRDCALGLNECIPVEDEEEEEEEEGLGWTPRPESEEYGIIAFTELPGPMGATLLLMLRVSVPLLFEPGTRGLGAKATRTTREMVWPCMTKRKGAHGARKEQKMRYAKSGYEKINRTNEADAPSIERKRQTEEHITNTQDMETVLTNLISNSLVEGLDGMLCSALGEIFDKSTSFWITFSIVENSTFFDFSKGCKVQR